MSDLGPLRVELTASPRGGSLMLTVGGYLLPVADGSFTFGATSRFPELTVSLPVIDGAVVSLDAGVSVSGETRAALVAMGWTPPDGESMPAPAFIGKVAG